MNLSRMKKVMVTGGAGYKGCVLVPKLLEAGYETVVYDLLLFGAEGLPTDPRLTLVEGDVRDTAQYAHAVQGCDAVIHMACISNDPSFELDAALSRSINYDCFEPLVTASQAAGVRRFIYVSSSSVYGVSDAPEVTEEHPLVPLTDYNKYKGLCEPILLRYQSPEFTTVIVRPATVCGYSPRMRFDLTVNILTNHAVNKGRITVFGGEQKRPNLHIQDMCDAYQLMIEAPAEKISGETFNIGYQNQKIIEIAEIVRKVVEEVFPEKRPIEIVRTESNDNRSYHINSDKIFRGLGFRPKRSIEDAVRDLCAAFKSGLLPNSFDNDWYYNVRTMKAIKAA